MRSRSDVDHRRRWSPVPSATASPPMAGSMSAWSLLAEACGARVERRRPDQGVALDEEGGAEAAPTEPAGCPPLRLPGVVARRSGLDGLPQGSCRPRRSSSPASRRTRSMHFFPQLSMVTPCPGARFVPPFDFDVKPKDEAQARACRGI